MGPGSRFALLFLALMVCGVCGEGVSFHGRESRRVYCAKVMNVVGKINKHYSDAWQGVEGAVARIKSLSIRCGHAVPRVEPEGRNSLGATDKETLMEPLHFMIHDTEKQIESYDKKLRELVNEVVGRCDFWLSFMPITPTFKRTTKSKLLEARSLLRFVEELRGKVESLVDKTEADMCVEVNDAGGSAMEEEYDKAGESE
ncbi:Putative cell surface-expressed gene family [Trypanosoma congolense IL3000]|uniref:Putative cell surface-expressed gene family n=1 Tax=Trypanosoma congolense (strain IL3000) TaxID=1068625 RepID=F9W6J0_TRYCI|nr:Putative cell surface-expressed gene family [Trypanosoma congolense IL3000]